jgi:fructosamine-3-kinase
MLDDVVRRELAAVLGSWPGTVSPVGGGCVSPAARVTLEDGRLLFVKTSPARGTTGKADRGDRLFEEEARSLARLRAAGALRVPEVIAARTGWLALEWLEPAGAVDVAALGRGLARLHATSGPDWGWDSDNFIGPLTQANGAANGWPAFWRERRLLPQIERAAALSDTTRRDFDRLLGELDTRLGVAGTEPPSLLHGDLWSGNVHPTAAGPALIDPASYYGHREVDLAMAALFGGFGADFERAYEAEWPLLPGARIRCAIYQLYYLLVHVNLFGAGYLPSTIRTLQTALS